MESPVSEGQVHIVPQEPEKPAISPQRKRLCWGRELLSPVKYTQRIRKHSAVGTVSLRRASSRPPARGPPQWSRLVPGETPLPCEVHSRAWENLPVVTAPAQRNHLLLGAPKVQDLFSDIEGDVGSPCVRQMDPNLE